MIFGDTARIENFAGIFVPGDHKGDGLSFVVETCVFSSWLVLFNEKNMMLQIMPAFALYCMREGNKYVMGSTELNIISTRGNLIEMMPGWTTGTR